jgi:sporulation protein YabP
MNTEAERGRKNEHTLTLRQRESMEINGVTDVVSFDEQAVVLQTVCGTMTVEGSSLHIHVLSMEEGIVTLDGKVYSVAYEESDDGDANSKSNFFGKLFR